MVAQGALKIKVIGLEVGWQSGNGLERLQVEMSRVTMEALSDVSRAM